MALPVSFKDFAKNPVVATLFIVLCGISALYIDVRSTFKDQITSQAVKVQKLDEKVDIMQVALRRCDSSLASATAKLSTEAQIAEIYKQLQAIELAGCCAQLQAITAEIQKQIQALEVQPVFDPALISQAIASLFSAPATKTANFAVADNETWLINNKSGSSCTVTLPSTGINIGRVLHFQNYQNQTLVSASSNVVPLAGGTATTAILEAVAGANATLVSNGTSWIMTQYDSNNSLELE